ncbi:hypothetical protein [Nocardioides humi]|uniref:Uncharacterized protein n=1 Tax=Nocardioides humi TaxID=449461 RepID=A0ABN2AK28_9ACTN|nr:hypothetical protein [Nocardioides humi]
MAVPEVSVLLTDTERNLWTGAIVGGFVVVLAVAALLTILVLLVRTIEQRVTTVRDKLRAAAENTEDTALIAETADGVEAVLGEGLKHHLFLGRVYEKVRA